MTESPWEIVGVEPGADRAEIKRAYARRLRSVHPEDDPEGFQRLRRAYEWLMSIPEGAIVVVSEHRASTFEPSPRPQPALPTENAPAGPALADEPHEGRESRVRELVDELLGLADREACARLAELLESEEAEGWDFRLELEEELARRLLAMKFPPPLLVEKASEIWRWRSRPERLRAEVRGVGALFVRLSRSRAKAELDARTADEESAEGMMYRVLLGPPRPRWFVELGRSSENREAALFLLDLFATEPDLLPHRPDPRVLAWWRWEATRARMSKGKVLGAMGIAILFLGSYWDGFSGRVGFGDWMWVEGLGKVSAIYLGVVAAVLALEWLRISKVNPKPPDLTAGTE